MREDETEDEAEETKAVEEWAEQKGLLPEWSAQAGPGGERRQNPHYWKFAGAKASKRWTAGFAVTEADFDAAIKEVETQIQR